MGTAFPADMRRQLDRASDEQVARVVALVDVMPQRGAADDLIAPLRPRLAALPPGLAPARPLSLTRLMFSPLDPVIIDPRDWRADTPAVPRSALGCLGAAIMQRIDPTGSTLRPLVTGLSAADAALAGAKAGVLLWPAAAACLAELPIPDDWRDRTGLPAACFEVIRASAAAVLRQAVRLRALDQGDRAEGVRVILADTQARDPTCLGIVLAVLLTLDAGATVAANAPLPPASVEIAVGHALERADRLVDIVVPAVGLASAAVHAAGIADLLEAVDQPGRRPALRDQVRRTRQAADLACRARLSHAVQRDFLPKLAGSAIDDVAVTELEGVARDLRRLGLAGRRLGAPAAYDLLLEPLVADIQALQRGDLSSMDRLRLAELLVGTEAGLRLTQGGGLLLA